MIGFGMRIAFYAPLKFPSHPVPSGDRQMARLLVTALERAGHTVEIASTLRAFSPEPDCLEDVRKQAREEATRLAAQWTTTIPDLWFAYHPYYKAPDLIGPLLAHRFGLPYVTAEASHSPRRDRQGWAEAQSLVLDAVKLAAVNIFFTRRDAEGLQRAAPEVALARLE